MQKKETYFHTLNKDKKGIYRKCEKFRTRRLLLPINYGNIILQLDRMDCYREGKTRLTRRI